jgi:hypothetical protein
MPRLPNDDVVALRQGLADLPGAPNHRPGGDVDPNDIVPVPAHRAALDPDRPLVVGNRGMGKSFWAHALADDTARAAAALAFPELDKIKGRMGFNGSDRSEQIAPARDTLAAAVKAGVEPAAAWRSVVLRAAREVAEARSPQGTPDGSSLLDLGRWVGSNVEAVDREMTVLDDAIAGSGRKLVVVFDALDRLADDGTTMRELAKALLQRALAARSYRAVRLKLFLRSDQFDDVRLFAFADSSKIKNTRVDLRWPTENLWGLLFLRLARACAEAFAHLGPGDDPSPSEARVKEVVAALAGPFMGTDKRRGWVHTWVPTHLADARGDASPRTFLTAWREAARHRPAPRGRAVDHLGLHEGVRKASEDRLNELGEDYPWIKPALAALRGAEVPSDPATFANRWRKNGTIAEARESTLGGNRLMPFQLESVGADESALIQALVSIGVMELRTNGKVNVPDIFRVEAGIKRRGGVVPPKRG